MKKELIANYSKRIGEVFYDWLQEEVTSSGTDKNSFLDEYDTVIAGLKAGWDHPDNFAARKNEAHLGRLPVWFEAFKQDPDNDYQAAKLAFAGLMLVSGCYRDQCYVQAQDAEDYIDRRGKAIGIPYDLAIKMRLQYLLPAKGELSRAHIDVDHLYQSMKAVSKIGETAINRLTTRVSEGHDLKAESSPSVTQMKYAQLEWFNFATESVILFAKMRGGFLSAVPLLEPKSISADPSPKVIYPFN